MSLSSYRMHRIYLSATMNYGLGSNDPEELAYYNKIRKEMDDMKKEPFKKGIPLNWDNPEKSINEFKYFFINWWKSYAYWFAYTDIFKGKKIIEILQDFNHIQIQLLILYPYKGVPQTVHIYLSDSLPD